LRFFGGRWASGLSGGRLFDLMGRRLWRPPFFGRWRCAEPADDCIQAWSKLLFQFRRQLRFYPTGLTDCRPIDMAIQERRRFSVDDQA
jgi:hypothetical protein